MKIDENTFLFKEVISMDELLEFFKVKGVPIQITLDLDVKPTVHALFNKDGRKIHKTGGETIFEALSNMKMKLFKYSILKEME